MIIYIGNYLTDHNKTPNFNIYLTQKFEAMGYRVVRASDKKYKLPRLLHMLYTIWRNRKNATYIYIDAFSSDAFWFAYFTARLSFFLKIPFFTIIRGGGMETRLRKSPKATSWLFKKSKKNISPSLYLEAVFKKQQLPVIYIPNFLDIKNYPFKSANAYGPRLLWVRSLHQIYQPVMACQVVEELQSSYPDIRLTMVGPDKDGSAEEVRTYIQEHGLTERIRLTGKLSKNEWHTLAAEHDIFINTTSVDNHPVSVIEAMALGLPVVSTNPGGMVYLIDNGQDGLLSDSDDLKGMCAHIRYIIEHPLEANRLAKAARAKVEKFDWAEVEPLYKALMS